MNRKISFGCWVSCQKNKTVKQIYNKHGCLSLHIPTVNIALRSVLLWNFTQRRMLVSYRRFGTTYRFHLEGQAVQDKVLNWTAWPFKMGPISFPETSVRSYNSALRKIPKEHSYHLHRGGKLKWNKHCVILRILFSLQFGMQFILQKGAMSLLAAISEHWEQTSPRLYAVSSPRSFSWRWIAIAKGRPTITAFI